MIQNVINLNNLYTADLFCYDGDVRLIGGLRLYEGRVEICFNETWGTICDDGWGTQDANVTCKQLGYTGYSSSCMYSTKMYINCPLAKEVKDFCAW